MKIEFINKSSLPHSQAATIVNALQIQVTRDFAPVWGTPAELIMAPQTQANPTPGLWTIAFLDNADQAGALGYHDLTADGLPLGKIFVRTTLSDGGLVSVTSSHELLEMLADPDINLSAEADDASGNPAKFVGYEVCDAVEDDSLGYKINGVTVSDFLYPAYFESFRRINSTQFDYQKKVTRPFEILPGGYLGVLDLSKISEGWQQVTAYRSANMKSRAPVGSRRERRAVPRDRWQLSEYK